MKLYYAGADSKNLAEILKRNQIQNILQSGYYLKYSKEPNELKFDDLLLDSGGYTAIVKKFDLDIKTYIDFVNKFNVKKAITLDVPDFQKTVRNTYLLKQETNATILPVFHDTDFLKVEYRGVLEKYCADFDYLCIAGINRRLLTQEQKVQMGDFVFNITRNKIKVHGLAITNKVWNDRWPFYSTDSTSWLACSSYGNSKIYKRESKLLKFRNKEVSYIRRIEEELSYWKRFEKQTTELWRARGIIWQ